MILLTISIIVFIIVIALIVYANWPAPASGNSCGGCPSEDPCNGCGAPKPRCRCPPAGGCKFC
jgi:hypothetical protein